MSSSHVPGGPVVVPVHTNGYPIEPVELSVDLQLPGVSEHIIISLGDGGRSSLCQVLSEPS
jgi:hypothetical protein